MFLCGSKLVSVLVCVKYIGAHNFSALCKIHEMLPVHNKCILCHKHFRYLHKTNTAVSAFKWTRFQLSVTIVGRIALRVDVIYSLTCQHY